MIWRFALRNLLRTARKTIIILTLEAVVISAFFFGNSVIDQTRSGLRSGFQDNFTGDVVIKPITEIPVSLFGAVTPSIDEYYAVPQISHYDKIETRLGAFNEISGSTPVLSGLVEMRIDTRRKIVPAFGVRGMEYLSQFKNIRIIEGAPFAEFDEGVLISETEAIESRRHIKKSPVGEFVTLSAYSESGFKIREVPITGVFRYAGSSDLLDKIVLTDPLTMRTLQSVFIGGGEGTAITGDSIELLDTSLDDLFSVSVGDRDSVAAGTDIPSETERILDIVEGLDDIERDSDSVKSAADDGWQFVLVSMKDGTIERRFLGELNSFLYPLGAEAVDWKSAAGISAVLVLLLGSIFNGGFFLVLIAGVIAVVNVLIVATFERTIEIGTMRALGATKRYIRQLIIVENLIVSCAAGILGIGVAVVAIFLLNDSTVDIDNNLLRTLFGGDTLQIAFSMRAALAAFFLSGVVGFISSLFPIAVSLRITPAKAMAEE